MDALEDKATVYIDIAGDVAVRSRLHRHLADNAQRTFLVGATHWDQFGKSVDGGALPGAEPEMFFAPAQIEKRNAEWGRGVIMRQAYAASMQLLQRLSPLLTIEHHAGAEACVALWQALLDNQVSGATRCDDDVEVRSTQSQSLVRARSKQHASRQTVMKKLIFIALAVACCRAPSPHSLAHRGSHFSDGLHYSVLAVGAYCFAVVSFYPGATRRRPSDFMI